MQGKNGIGKSVWKRERGCVSFQSRHALAARLRDIQQVFALIDAYQFRIMKPSLETPKQKTRSATNVYDPGTSGRLSFNKLYELASPDIVGKKPE
jgi:hypothetical protein